MEPAPAGCQFHVDDTTLTASSRKEGSGLHNCSLSPVPPTSMTPPIVLCDDWKLQLAHAQWQQKRDMVMDKLRPDEEFLRRLRALFCEGVRKRRKPCE